MSRGSRLPLLLLFAAAAFVIALIVRSRAMRQHAREATRSAAADSAFADSILRVTEDIGASVTIASSDLPPPVRDSARIERLLAQGAAGTYIGALLAARDSTIYRWIDRAGNPVRVWVQESALQGADPAAHAMVQEAFTTWAETGIPVDFRFVMDSVRADVHVTWVDRYESRTSGRTRWAHDQHDWIVGGGIELALRQPDGRALEPRAILAIARHEVGHLLGLDHSPSERDIMAANVRVPELSEADVLTIRLLYELPPGRLGQR